MQAIGEWGATWSFTEPRAEELDPSLLIVWMAATSIASCFHPDRTVVQFDFSTPKRRFWMVLEPSEVSVCLQHPGFDVDLQVVVDTATLYRVYLGRAELGGAIRAGQAGDERAAGTATRIRPLVHLERIRPSEPLGPGRRTAASRLASPHRVQIADGGDPG